MAVTFLSSLKEHIVLDDVQVHDVHDDGSLQQDDKPAVYTCTWPGCSYSSHLKDTTSRHRRSHDTRRVCGWNGCSYGSSRADTLARHKRTHTGERPKQCDWEGCSYRATNAANLVVHRRRHTGEQPHKCDWPGCSYSTAVKSNLNSHRRHHTGETPYKCIYPGCTHSASKRSNLNAHMRSHGPEFAPPPSPVIATNMAPGQMPNMTSLPAYLAAQYQQPNMMQTLPPDMVNLEPFSFHSSFATANPGDAMGAGSLTSALGDSPVRPNVAPGAPSSALMSPMSQLLGPRVSLQSLPNFSPSAPPAEAFTTTTTQTSGTFDAAQTAGSFTAALNAVSSLGSAVLSASTATPMEQSAPTGSAAMAGSMPGSMTGLASQALGAATLAASGLGAGSLNTAALNASMNPGLGTGALGGSTLGGTAAGQQSLAGMLSSLGASSLGAGSLDTSSLGGGGTTSQHTDLSLIQPPLSSYLPSLMMGAGGAMGTMTYAGLPVSLPTQDKVIPAGGRKGRPPGLSDARRSRSRIHPDAHPNMPLLSGEQASMQLASISNAALGASPGTPTGFHPALQTAAASFGHSTASLPASLSSSLPPLASPFSVSAPFVPPTPLQNATTFSAAVGASPFSQTTPGLATANFGQGPTTFVTNPPTATSSFLNVVSALTAPGPPGSQSFAPMGQAPSLGPSIADMSAASASMGGGALSGGLGSGALGAGALGSGALGSGPLGADSLGTGGTLGSATNTLAGLASGGLGVGPLGPTYGAAADLASMTEAGSPSLAFRPLEAPLLPGVQQQLPSDLLASNDVLDKTFRLAKSMQSPNLASIASNFAFTSAEANSLS